MIYKIESGELIEVVEAKTPEKAIKKFVKYYDLPEQGYQRLRIKLEYLGNRVL